MATMRLLGASVLLGFRCSLGGAFDDAEGLLQTSALQQDANPTTFGDAIMGMVSVAFEHMDRSVSLLDVSGQQTVEGKPKAKGPRGVRFSRNITRIEQGSSMTMLMSTNQATWADDEPEALSCMEHDRWGDNRCRFEYGSSLRFKVAAKIGTPIKEGSKIIIDIPRPVATKPAMAAMMVKRIKPMHVECPACNAEGNCTVTYMENTIKLKIPPCPIPAGETVFVDKTFPLPNVPGMGAAEGQMKMEMLAVREDGSTLGQVSMSFGMGSLETPDGPVEEDEDAEDGKAKRKHHHHR